MVRPIDLIPSSLKLVISISYDITVITLAFFAAYIFRLGISDLAISLPELLVVATAALTSISLFYYFDIYRSVVRYFNAKSALKIIAILASAAASCFLTSALFDAFIPYSVPLIFLVFASAATTGARALFSWAAESRLLQQKEGVLIYGAGSTGRQLAGTLIAGKVYQPLAFIDEKQKLQGRSILGLKILPATKIEALISKYGNVKILIAVTDVNPIRMKEIVHIFEPFALELLAVPNISDIVSGKRTIDELREVSVDELLGREPVTPMSNLMSANIKNKIVLVSGAGGSIGKEICRQIIKQSPKKLVLLDVCEAFLYEINQELTEIISEEKLTIELVPLIGNVQNGMLMNRTLACHKIQTIYHTAAYKHVPMVENNVIAGISNNVLGTSELAQAAVLCDVETFVLISTDKAVRPTNVMGATKRLAELVLQGLAQQQHNTRFVMVRFGNVLGSSGSVVPLFKKQIRKGGPITVTHPDIIRYFMTIPEAAQLVIQAGAMGQGGDVFVLDMGKPVKILDLAYKMAHLMGLTVKDDSNPEGDIAIEFSGLRPGEKLYEELLIDDHAQETYHQRILTANEHSIPYIEVNRIVGNLIDAMTDEDIGKIRQLLMAAPLGYMPKSDDNHEVTPIKSKSVPPNKASEAAEINLNRAG
ncbi:MAG: polysaccharide biosynthesis protein [Thalassotalea sp.]